jgi:hypothetical protein
MAIVWCSKAAEQGHGAAQEVLDALQALEEEEEEEVGGVEPKVRIMGSDDESE